MTIRYKDKHFYTLHQHLKYMKEVEQLNNVDIAVVLRELWNCNNIEIGFYLDEYEKEDKDEV